MPELYEVWLLPEPGWLLPEPGANSAGWQCFVTLGESTKKHWQTVTGFVPSAQMTAEHAFIALCYLNKSGELGGAKYEIRPARPEP